MARKPIQIAVVPSILPSMEGSPAVSTSEIFALCDDGSIWSIAGKDGAWIPLPPLPQRQSLDAWKDAVKNYLLNRHGIRRDLVFQTVDEKQGYLNEQYRADSAAQDVADTIARGLGVVQKS